MREYRVAWEVTMEAYTPRQAAIMALDTMRDSRSTAVVFDVYPPPGRGVDEEPISIDLLRYVQRSDGKG